MNDDSTGPGRRRHPFRYILFSLAALLVLSLGFRLIPAEPPAPAPPSVADIARSAALDDALRLRTAGARLAARAGDKPAPGAGVGDVVTLLTLQARALLQPEATPQPPTTSTAVAGLSLQGLASDLAASGARRLQDATTTDDGGLARLLAGVGTGQLLAAERLQPGAAAAQLKAATAAAASPPRTAPDSQASPCPSPTTAAAATVPAEAAASASPDAAAALAAVVLAEREAVYAYEAAMPRLAPGPAGPASAYLGNHRGLVRDAESRLHLDCRRVPAQQPGYAIDAGFLQSPAGRLGMLEAGTLGAYGDLIALSEGGSRAWAVSALPAAAARAAHWGTDPGPVPGLALEPAQLPHLPELSEPAGQPGLATQRTQR